MWAAALALLAGACAAASGPAHEAAQAWAEGPARWLLLPDERATLAEVATTAELTAFLQAFWSRRDADPHTPGNAFGDLYARRVADADRLYGEEGVRGALTDRGGTLLLLGPPSILSYSAREVPTWGNRRAPGPRPTRPVRVETWTYLPQDLHPRLRALRERRGEGGPAAVTFLVGPRHTRLIEGREVLAQAACAWARCDEDD